MHFLHIKTMETNKIKEHLTLVSQYSSIHVFYCQKHLTSMVKLVKVKATYLDKHMGLSKHNEIFIGEYDFVGNVNYLQRRCLKNIKLNKSKQLNTKCQFNMS